MKDRKIVEKSFMQLKCLNIFTSKDLFQVFWPPEFKIIATTKFV